MKAIYKLIWPWREETVTATAATDPTHYHVQTHTHLYSGVIVTQDNVAMRLQCTNGKQVKILKENILKISIDESH